jgi:hypothetical protein
LAYWDERAPAHAGSRDYAVRGEIVTAVLDAGLDLTMLTEHAVKR